MKFLFFALMFFFSACKSNGNEAHESVIANGQMPAITSDKQNALHLTYGSGDSLMYMTSTDQGKTFSAASLIAVVPELAASHTRGPQIAVTTTGLVLTACDATGNIFSFVKKETAQWKQSTRVNDLDTVAKENLMSLSAEGNLVFAVWLDLRDKHNKIFGAKSIDGGNTWSKNMMIYAWPDTTVCECCKPSVLVKGNNVYIMFRNWLDGNRDLYLIQSSDAGDRFGEAVKLGNGSWKLDGCPMDGGALVAAGDGAVQTVWNRKGKVYASAPGHPEKELGEGRGCTMESVNGKNVYAWVEKGEVMVLNPMGERIRLGKGQLPVLKSIDNKNVLCLWEDKKQIHKAIVEL